VVTLAGEVWVGIGMDGYGRGSRHAGTSAVAAWW
jgi:hypothetical protein